MGGRWKRVEALFALPFAASVHLKQFAPKPHITPWHAPLHVALHAASDPGVVKLLWSYVLHQNPFTVTHAWMRFGAPVVVLPAGQSAHVPPPNFDRAHLVRLPRQSDGRVTAAVAARRRRRPPPPLSPRESLPPPPPPQLWDRPH